MQLIVLILFRQSGVLSVYISRAILITQEVHATKHYAYINSYIAFRTRGLSTDYQLTTTVQAHYIVMNSNVRVDQHKSQTTEGESRRTVGG